MADAPLADTLVPDDILILSDEPDGPWHTATETFSDRAKESLRGRRMVVLLAGQGVRTLSHALPPLKPRERLEAARFHAEPDLGQSGDLAHIVIGDADMAVVDRAHMQRIAEELDAAGVVAASIHADYHVLPPCTLPDRVVLDGATVDHGFPLSDVPPDMDFADAIARADLADALDLQTAEFARKRSFAPGIPAGWLKAAAALALFAGVSFGALQLAQSRAETAQIADLRERAVQAYAEATGERVADPVRAVQALPDATPGRAGALELTGLLFAALERVPGASVDRLTFRDGEMELRMAYPGFDAPSELERAVGELGGSLRAGGVRETGGRFVGDASLSVGGGQT